MAVILTGIALICIVSGQFAWLYQIYHLHHALFEKYANRMLVNAVDEEFNMRSEAMVNHIIVTPTDVELDKAELDSIARDHDVSPVNTIIEIKHPTGPESNVQGRIKYAINYALPPDIYDIDSIYADLIRKEYPNDKVYIELIDSTGTQIIRSTAQEDNQKHRYVTQNVPLDNPAQQTVRGVVASSPLFIVFTQSTGTMVLSVFFALLAVGCTLYIIRVVFKQKKYTQSVTDYTHYTVHQMQTPIMLATLSLKKLHSKTKRNKSFQVDPYIDISEKNLKKLSSLSDSLLSIATQENSSMKITREPFDIVEAVTALANETPLKQQGKQIKISVENHLSNPLIEADQFHMGNAVSNLIDNAIKYSGEKVTIKISLENIPNGICISVEDNGIGIDKEHIHHVFDRFYRVTGEHRTKGFGLGLSYVQAVCEAHNGSVRVYSEKGEGSRFVMDIPTN